jgi:hypothetical protein
LAASGGADKLSELITAHRGPWSREVDAVLIVLVCVLQVMASSSTLTTRSMAARLCI